jgi:hypothetical protein
MKEQFEFETPILEEASFGQFVAGASGEANDNLTPDGE